MKYPIPAVIFAGGKSSRMGTDKALLPFGKYKTLSEFQYHKLKQWFETVYISSKTNKFNFRCPIIEDVYEESSPLVGIVSVFRALPVEAVFILSVDAPLVDESIIKRLWESYREEENVFKDAIIAKSPNGLQPLCGIYKRSILPYALKNLSQNNHRLGALFGVVTIKTVIFNDETRFTNLNTQEEYQRLLHPDFF